MQERQAPPQPLGHKGPRAAILVELKRAQRLSGYGWAIEAERTSSGYLAEIVELRGACRQWPPPVFRCEATTTHAQASCSVAQLVGSAISDSVTVSIAAETSGMRSSMPRENRLTMETSFGCVSECRGARRTSSKVSARSSRTRVNRLFSVS